MKKNRRLRFTPVLCHILLAVLIVLLFLPGKKPVYPPTVMLVSVTCPMSLRTPWLLTR